jgi:hypothetical protein
MDPITTRRLSTNYRAEKTSWQYEPNHEDARKDIEQQGTRSIRPLPADVVSSQLAALSKLPIRSPSFPHALSGGSTELTTGGFGTGPPTKTFGGDAFKINLIAEI